MAGASAGAIVAALVAAGYSAKELRRGQILVGGMRVYAPECVETAFYEVAPALLTLHTEDIEQL